MNENAPEVIEPCDEFACTAPGTVPVVAAGITLATLCPDDAARLASRYELYRKAADDDGNR